MAFDFQPQQVLTSGLTPSGSGILGGTIALGPTFRVQQLANTRKVQYAMVHMDSTQTKVVETFIFPISPQSLTMPRKSLTNIFETMGPASQQNVRRIVDLYGLTPQTFMIRGTTGFNKYSADGFKQGGIDWMKSLQTFIEGWFNNLNTGVQPDTMQFFDFFFNELWWVVPVGPMVIRHDASKPLWMYYELTLAGLNRLSSSQTSAGSAVITSSLSNNQSKMSALQGTMQGIVTSAAILGPYI